MLSWCRGERVQQGCRLQEVDDLVEVGVIGDELLVVKLFEADALALVGLISRERVGSWGGDGVGRWRS